ncbi:BEL1-like homeodomain protein 1 [Chenopodium quinoa]|uniref:BEL1-like homeodomain protein 1 n=1 Tax=Chenopodium quinoa TaxID=63459 RepID=UPI000B76CD1B|nr:BEL1-like homeodomain protein 1 [Chenopodium quinoa]
MMATYFHGGPEIQAAAAGDHNLQTLYLMNPNFITTAYSEGQTPPNMLFLNPANSLSQGNLPHAPPPQQQQFIGIPLSGPHPSQDHGRPSPTSSGSQHQIPAALHGLSVSRVHPNLWSPAANPGSNQAGPIPSAASGPDMADQMGFRRPMSAHQGLSLSLSPGQQQQNQSQVTVAAVGGSSTSNGVIIGSKYLKPAQELLEEVVNVGSNSTNFNDKANSGGDNTTTNNNGDNRIGDSSGAHKDKAKAAAVTARDHSSVGETSRGGGGGESSSGGTKKAAAAAEMSTAQRQELQMKKAKLLNMLDEVEQRYRQYNSQIQLVVSSFEQAAGIGSAKLYTSLALKTISKQFRCLKDAIMSQIKATSKSLGEEESNSNALGVKLEGGAGSRLRFVDHQLRQQRALQQLGMMQHNAWRPQRGLPERAVSVLRAWLFEHFLHPYPKDSDKHMLAKQTGLTRSQVSNWFINARVRLWKPMVEEMYLEEVKTQEQNSGNSEDNTTTANKNGKSSKNDDHTTSKETGAGQQREQQDHGGAVIQPHQQQADHTTNDMISNLSAMSATSSQGFTLIGSSSDMESLMARSPKKQRSNSDIQNSPSSILSMDMEMKPVDHHQRHSFLMTNHGDAAATGFNPYLVNDMTGRFNPDQMTAHPYHGNAVSLTLGLPHCENLSLGNHQQNFLPNQGIQLGRRLDIGPAEADFCGISMAQPSHPNNGYESIDIQNRNRFAAHQLLHDFVA